MQETTPTCVLYKSVSSIMLVYIVTLHIHYYSPPPNLAICVRNGLSIIVPGVSIFSHMRLANERCMAIGNLDIVNHWGRRRK